jgi:hypothetical protein
MSGGGIIWGAIICIPFWLLVIWLIKTGVIALQTLIFVGLGLTLSGLLLFLILRLPLKAKQEKKYWDTFIKNIATPPTQSKPHPKDSSASVTPHKIL